MTCGDRQAMQALHATCQPLKRVATFVGHFETQELDCDRQEPGRVGARPAVAGIDNDRRAAVR